MSAPNQQAQRGVMLEYQHAKAFLDATRVQLEGFGYPPSVMLDASVLLMRTYIAAALRANIHEPDVAAKLADLVRTVFDLQIQGIYELRDKVAEYTAEGRL